MDADGSNQRNLSNNAAADSLPSWSPDGAKVLFQSKRDGNLEIYRMEASGAGQTRITNNSLDDTEPDWGAASEVADLSIGMTASRSPAVVNRVLTYTLSVRNDGPSQAPGVVVTDQLPSGPAYVSSAASQGTCSRSGGTVTCQLGVLAPGAGATVEVRVRPNQPMSFVNTASVSGEAVDPDSSDDAASVRTQAVISADLSITKKASRNPALVNQIFNYSLTLGNAGPAAATNVIVRDTLPAGPSFVSAEASQGSCAFASGTVTCQMGGLASGATATVLIKVKPRQAATLTNTATVSAAEYDHEAGNNSATIETAVVNSADLSLKKTDSADPVLLGGQVTYTLTVTNNGPVQATGVILTDTLPAGMAFVSASSSRGAITSAPAAGSSGTVVADLGALNVSASATVTITVTATQAGVFTNSASVSGNEVDQETTNNAARQSTTVVMLQKLLLSASNVVGGCQHPSGTVYLTSPAPAGGVTVSLSSTAAGASTPASVAIPGGATKSAPFAVNTSPVASTQSGLIRATLGAKTVSRTLTLNTGSCP